nr:GDP-mannose 4,6-dehydratase [Bradyrhizobium liaoningense]
MNRVTGRWIRCRRSRQSLQQQRSVPSNGYSPICGRSLLFRHADIREEAAVYDILRCCGVTAVVHLAGLKAVGESNVQSITYCENNVLGTTRLASTMTNAKVKTLVFSSSATVYGISTYLPLDEEHPLEPTNPYGSQSFSSKKC